MQGRLMSVYTQRAPARRNPFGNKYQRRHSPEYIRKKTIKQKKKAEVIVATMIRVQRAIEDPPHPPALVFTEYDPK